MTDKIQEELEKVLALVGWSANDEVCDKIRKLFITQHLTTKQAMIKDEIDSLVFTIDRIDNYQEDFANLDWITKEHVAEILRQRLTKLNAEKQKLGELK
jgi:hypothetical protein